MDLRQKDTDEREEQIEIEDVTLPAKRVDESLTVGDRLTENTKNDIITRYAIRDEDGEAVEDWDDIFRRVAEDVASAETEVGGSEEDESEWAKRFYDAMAELRFMPNSPTLMNAGGDLQQLSACFVRNPKDDMDDINKAQSDAAAIFKSGGGVGYAFHHLRPKGARVSSTGGVSSGPMSFMQLYDTTCGTVKQGGKRRGAQMGIMHAQHPDVGRFAVSKRGEDNLSNFNISIGITDEFIEAVKNGETYTMYDPTAGFEPSDDKQAFDVVPETAHFYDPQFEDAWNEDFDKPSEGLDGKVVEENFWRDYQDEMADPEAFDEYRDDLHMETGEAMEIPAGFIWQLLIDGAWNNGEPGIFYLDETNREHSFDVEEYPDHYVHSTNPCCVTGDTRIHTDDGMKRIDDLVESDAPDGVVTDGRLGGNTVEDSSEAFVTGTDDVYHLQTEEGYSIRLTGDHPVRTDEGWIEAQHLDPGEQIHVLNRKGSFGDGGSSHLGHVLGWLVGDGHCKDEEERAVLNFYGDDTTYSESFERAVNHIVREPTGNGDYHISSNIVTRKEDQGSSVSEERIRSERLYEIAEEYSLTDEKLQVPEKIFQSSERCAAGFLRGLFSSDGSVQGSVEKGFSVRLATTSRTLAYDVQELLSNFGIYSRVYEDRREGGTSVLPDGRGGEKEYETKALHEVVISSSDMVRFRNEIGFIHDEKSDTLREALDSYTHGPRDRTFSATVESLEYDGHETVYDITEDTTHSFVANGLVVHNSEQPLEELEACNLGHVNLSLMVDEDAELFGEFVGSVGDFDRTDRTVVRSYLDQALDHETFEQTIEEGTRFLDNVVTRSDFPLDRISEQVRNKRKIGLGLMGFHQMLIQMGVEYGSPESFVFANEIMRRIDEKSVDVSHDLSKERGVFEEWHESKWSEPLNHPDWFRKHAHMDPENAPNGYPVRNHNQTTIAPTGTTSMIGNTTGGCEPMYQVAYMKNVGDDIQGEENLVEFDDYFLLTLEANGIDVDAVKEEAEEQMLNNDFNGTDSLETVPDEIGELFVVTGDLSAEQHIDMQAAFQQFCDSGISKTINASYDTTIEEVGEAFLKALDLGIKGTTVYRSGSRNEQVLKENVDEREFSEEERETLITEAKALVRKDDEAAETILNAIEGGEN